jgi:hypothetical protein
MSNLPANVLNMAQALQISAGSAGSGGSDLYMKMGRDGVFEFGVDSTIPEEDSRWAINPAGCLHGFVAWGNSTHDNEGTNVGEVMVPATQPMPSEADLPNVKGDWSKATALQLRCTDGEDEGVQVLYKANSVGGRKAYAATLQAIVAKITEGDAACVPLVTLESDSYKHAKYGTIFNPIFKIQGWITMEGEAAAEPAAAIEEAPAEEPAPKEEPAAEKPTRRRRKKA